MHDVNLRIFTTTIILYDSILYRMSSFDFFLSDNNIPQRTAANHLLFWTTNKMKNEQDFALREKSNRRHMDKVVYIHQPKTYNYYTSVYTCITYFPCINIYGS